jgi:hydrogenase maturation factor
MQSTINNSENYKNKSSEAGMSICIPRAFANITESRVRKVFDALGIFRIARVDMIQRKNEKGDAYQRIFVHIQDWTETADAQKARDRLLAGKELKIVYDDPWFWKASLNNWAPKPKPETTVYDRKPRIRLEFEDQDAANTDAAAELMSSLTLEDRDRRPYAERRVDPVYCEQDVKSGFRDRREPRDREPREQKERKSRFTPRSPSRSPPRDDRRRDEPRDDRRRDERRTDDYRRDDRRRDEPRRDDRRRDEPKIEQKFEKPVIKTPKPQKPAVVVAPVVVEPAEKPVVVAPKIVMNPDIRLMVATFLGIGRDEVTEEQYKNNAQFVRDLRQDDMDRQKDEDAAAGIKPLDYSGIPAALPKRRQRKVLVEEKTDV